MPIIMMDERGILSIRVSSFVLDLNGCQGMETKFCHIWGCAFFPLLSFLFSLFVYKCTSFFYEDCRRKGNSRRIFTLILLQIYQKTEAVFANWKLFRNVIR